MKARIATIIMAALLVLYLVFVTNYAILLITSTEALAKVMGFALILLPGIGAWVLVADLLFVVRGERLLAKLGGEGGLPIDNLPRLPSGRAEPEAADAEFSMYRAAVEAEPESWRAWLRLGLAYDASGDRRRARWATRRAIALHRSSGG
jgi:hypothetical protein